MIKRKTKTMIQTKICPLTRKISTMTQQILFARLIISLVCHDWRKSTGNKPNARDSVKMPLSKDYRWTKSQMRWKMRLTTSSMMRSGWVSISSARRQIYLLLTIQSCGRSESRKSLSALLALLCSRKALTLLRREILYLSCLARAQTRQKDLCLSKLSKRSM